MRGRGCWTGAREALYGLVNHCNPIPSRIRGQRRQTDVRDEQHAFDSNRGASEPDRDRFWAVTGQHLNRPRHARGSIRNRIGYRRQDLRYRKHGISYGISYTCYILYDFII